MGRLVSDEADIHASEFEKLRVGTFFACKEIFFMGFEFGYVEDGIEGCLHDLLWLRGNHWVLLEDNFFGLFGFSVEHDLAPLIDNFGEIEILEGLCRVQDGLFKMKFIKAAKSQDKDECK